MQDEELDPVFDDLAFRREQVETYLDLTRIDHLIAARSSDLFDDEKLEDVTPAQANVLLVLVQAKSPLTAAKLSDQLGLSEVTVSRFLRALQQKGWIERLPDPKDKRAMLIHPTAKTKRMLPRFIAVANSLLDTCFADFSGQEIRLLGRALARVRQNLQPSKDDVGSR
jgi:DNA-binding MarR family transcriptional regulator